MLKIDNVHLEEYFERRAHEAKLDAEDVLAMVLGLGVRAYNEMYPEAIVHTPTAPELGLLMPYMKNRGYQLPKCIRDYVRDRDNWTCQYCGSKDRIGVDHIVPMIRGGTHEFDNLVACCKSCNSRKYDKLLSETKFKLKRKPPKEPFSAIEYYRGCRNENKT